MGIRGEDWKVSRGERRVGMGTLARAGNSFFEVQFVLERKS